MIQKQRLVCLSCGFIGYPESKKMGTVLITIVLLCFFILPGLIYMLWRGSSRHNVCPSCGATNLVPITSPAGIKALESQGKTLASVEEDAKQEKLARPLLQQDLGQALRSIAGSLSSNEK
jgi:flagellar basal body-associated protein FliL